MIYVIAADGSADFTAMADAAKALPDGALIVYREGEHEEHAVFPQNNLRIVGEHIGRTKVDGRVAFIGKNAVVESMTFLGSVEGARFRDCVVGGQEITDAPPHAPCVYALGDADVPCGAHTRDARLPGYSVKRFVTEKRLNYAELCFLPGDSAVYCLSTADTSGDPRDKTDPLLTYPLYLAMVVNAARESGVALSFFLDSFRVDAHAVAARAFCQARNILLREAFL